MREYRVTLTGKTPMLMHRDDIEWADRMEAWKKDPANHSKGKRGDDRTPPYRWLGALYHDGARVTVPADNVMAGLMLAGAMVPTGRGKGTFKRATQSGVQPLGMGWPLLVKGHEVPVAPFFDGMELRTFDQFQELAAAHGFMLFLKRAPVGMSKHIRVRPRFDDWQTTVSLSVVDDQINDVVLKTIFDHFGQYKGLGSWRPGGKTPGPWGMFTATVEAI